MLESRRILLADDDTELRLGVAELLLGLGLEVLQAESGSEALELAQAETIHGALLDVHMPGYTGIEILPILRRTRADLPCIVYSGRWTPGLEAEVLRAGALVCLAKPVRPDVLRAAVLESFGLVDPRRGPSSN